VDTENLFAVIKRLRQRGVSIVYISHFLEECQRVAIVIRCFVTAKALARADGECGPRSNYSVDGGPRNQRHLSPHRIPLASRCSNCALAGQNKPRSVTLTLHEGEILGLAGLIGPAAPKLARVLWPGQGEVGFDSGLGTGVHAWHPVTAFGPGCRAAKRE
jgi:ribose transport system ATP-binding protein